ncbi:hypothetical protein Tco_1037848 [Tanacetum coccineum]
MSLEEDVRIEDVERLRQILTPPDDAYNAPAMNPILDELFDEFGNKLLDITVVDEEAYSNPTRDIEELKRLPAKDPRSYFTEIKVHSVIVKTNEESEPFIHTQTLSPLYGVFKSFKSSTKPYKVEREMTSPPWMLQQRERGMISPYLMVKWGKIVGVTMAYYAVAGLQKLSSPMSLSYGIAGTMKLCHSSNL